MSAHDTLAALAFQQELEAKAARLEADPTASPYTVKAARKMADWMTERNERMGISGRQEDPQN